MWNDGVWRFGEWVLDLGGGRTFFTIYLICICVRAANSPYIGNGNVSVCVWAYRKSYTFFQRRSNLFLFGLPYLSSRRTQSQWCDRIDLHVRQCAGIFSISFRLLWKCAHKMEFGIVCVTENKPNFRYADYLLWLRSDFAIPTTYALMLMSSWVWFPVSMRRPPDLRSTKTANKFGVNWVGK